MKELEIWSDSFHEGCWCCNNICSFLKKKGYSFLRRYVSGFIPQYTISKNGKQLLSLVVYGSYKSWTPLPQKIGDLLDWGKPDFVAYSPSEDKILFAVEETAATPTGNQAMQRCERQYGSAHLKIPYWYFVSEYGEHVDGGVRRDNIWPTIAALKLSLIQKTPCIVLHYSDIDNVEDYNAGKGLGLLFETLSSIIENIIRGRSIFDGMTILSSEFQEMISFLLSQWDNVIDFLPSDSLLRTEDTPLRIANIALNKGTPEDVKIMNDFLVWPLTDGVPEDILNSQHGKPLLKHDDLSQNLEDDVTAHKCYVLSNNASSGKPPTRDKVDEWIEKQRNLSLKSSGIDPELDFSMCSADFPDTETGRVHITTSKNIVYLYDKWSDLKKSIIKAYPRLVEKLTKINDESPVFLYVSNSLKPGRLFGDPYTGQLSAYSTSFGKFDARKRNVVVYFPHQVHTQVFDKEGHVVKNKGTTLLSELTDYIIFNGGIAVSLKDEEVF